MINECLQVEKNSYIYTYRCINISILTAVSQFFFFLVDDGLIQQSDLREVIKACMEENGMNFDEKEVEDLAQALYEDAAGLAAGESADNTKGITVEDLKAELSKHEGLLENLSIKYVVMFKLYSS